MSFSSFGCVKLLTTLLCNESFDFVNEEFPVEIQKLAKKQQVLNYAKDSNFYYTVLQNAELLLLIF